MHVCVRNRALSARGLPERFSVLPLHDVNLNGARLDTEVADRSLGEAWRARWFLSSGPEAAAVTISLARGLQLRIHRGSRTGGIRLLKDCTLDAPIPISGVAIETHVVVFALGFEAVKRVSFHTGRKRIPECLASFVIGARGGIEAVTVQWRP